MNGRCARGLVLAGLACGLLHPGIAPAASGECDSVDTERCDARYDPVCASWDTGIRCVTAPCPAAELRLYTNACLACRDERVDSFQYGECPERPEPEVGERYRVELPGLAGRHTQKDPLGGVVDVDLGVSFPIAVLRGWIRIEGDASPGTAESYEPPEGVIEMPVELHVALQESFRSGTFDIRSPVARLGPFDGPFKAEAPLGAAGPRPSSSTWRLLEDGRTRLQLTFARTCPGSCRFLEDAVVDIRRAELVVDAVPRDEADAP